MPKRSIILHQWFPARSTGTLQDSEEIVETAYPVTRILKVQETREYQHRLTDYTSANNCKDASFRSKVWLSKDECDYVTETVQEITALINGE